MIFITCFFVVSEKCKVNSIFALFIANVFAFRILILILGKLILWRLHLLFLYLHSIDIWLKLLDIDIKDVLWLLLGSTFFIIIFCILQVLLGIFFHRSIHIVFESILSDFSHSATLIIFFSNCWEHVCVIGASNLLGFDVVVDVAAYRTSRIRIFWLITLFWIMNIENHFSLLDWQWSALLQIDRIILWHRNCFG